MSETGKVHLGTGVSDGEDRVNEATEKAISNPLLENSSMSGAKGVLINITCGEDTSLHDIDLAINKIREESDEDANIIWGLQKDKDYNSKFKISVISTGIDSENYYKNVINKGNVTSITGINRIKNEITNDNQSNKIDIEQPSFLIDLRQPEKNAKNNELLAEEKILNEQHPEKNKVEKTSFFSRIFGTKPINKDNGDNLVNKDNEVSKNEFINEIREISEEEELKIENNGKIVIEDESFRFSDSSEHITKNNSDTCENDDKKNESQNDVNDDLLQIPAFLRRQAN